MTPTTAHRHYRTCYNLSSGLAVVSWLCFAPVPQGASTPGLLRSVIHISPSSCHYPLPQIFRCNARLTLRTRRYTAYSYLEFSPFVVSILTVFDSIRAGMARRPRSTVCKLSETIQALIWRNCIKSSTVVLPWTLHRHSLTFAPRLLQPSLAHRNRNHPSSLGKTWVPQVILQTSCLTLVEFS